MEKIGPKIPSGKKKGGGGKKNIQIKRGPYISTQWYILRKGHQYQHGEYLTNLNQKKVDAEGVGAGGREKAMLKKGKGLVVAGGGRGVYFQKRATFEEKKSSGTRGFRFNGGGIFTSAGKEARGGVYDSVAEKPGRKASKKLPIIKKKRDHQWSKKKRTKYGRGYSTVLKKTIRGGGEEKGSARGNNIKKGKIWGRGECLTQ